MRQASVSHVAKSGYTFEEHVAVCNRKQGMQAQTAVKRLADGRGQPFSARGAAAWHEPVEIRPQPESPKFEPAR